jgi:hypothetical protein
MKFAGEASGLAIPLPATLVEFKSGPETLVTWMPRLSAFLMFARLMSLAQVPDTLARVNPSSGLCGWIGRHQRIQGLSRYFWDFANKGRRGGWVVAECGC